MDIFRAVQKPLKTAEDVPRTGIATVVGLNMRGLPIEVLVDTTWPNKPVVFHAMPINNRRQRELLDG